MACLFISKPCLSLSQPLMPIRASFKPLQLPDSPAVRFSGDAFRRATRGLRLMTRAGPSSSSYVFAFVLPLSLLAITVVTALRIGDKLDKVFLEELARNQAILEEADEEEKEEMELDEADLIRSTYVEEKAAVRTRNRPKREM